MCAENPKDYDYVKHIGNDLPSSDHECFFQKKKMAPMNSDFI
jgi:hypothetical protein